MQKTWPQDAARLLAMAVLAIGVIGGATLAVNQPAEAQIGAFGSGPIPNDLSSARLSNRSLTYSGCVDIHGRQVAAYSNPQVADVARAFIDANSGIPTIVYNPTVLGWLQPATRLFFFIHECAHHVLGHAVGRATPSTMEQEADCWAIRRLSETGLLGRRDIGAIQSDLIRYGRGDHTHLPGEQRSDALAQCLSGTAAGLFGSPFGG